MGISRILLFVGKVFRRVLMMLYRPLFAAHGCHFTFDPFGAYSFSTISVGNRVSLGYRPVLIASRSHIRIGNHVMFGPEVVIMGGNHTTRHVGRFMNDVTDREKRPEDDREVVIDDDVWVARVPSFSTGLPSDGVRSSERVPSSRNPYPPMPSPLETPRGSSVSVGMLPRFLSTKHNCTPPTNASPAKRWRLAEHP